MNKFYSFILSVAILSSVIFLPVSQVYGQLEEDITIIDVGGSPAEMTLVNGDLYVSDPEEGRIIIIDGKTNEVKDTIPAQKGIDILKHVEGTNKIYATVFETPVILVINIDDKKLEKTIDFPESVMTLWSKSDKPYGQREYTSYQTSGVGMDYDPNDKMLYVSNFDGHSLEVIDTTTDEYARTIDNILSPVHTIIDAQTNTMLVLQYHENQISFVDLTDDKVTTEIDTGFAPANVALDTHHRKAYVTHHASPHIAVIDIDEQTIVKKIKIPSPAHAIGIDDDDEIIYATYMPDSPTTQEAHKNQVALIDGLSDRLLASLDIESNPYNILIDTENQKGYATIIKSGTVTTAYLETGEFERVEFEERTLAGIEDADETITSATEEEEDVSDSVNTDGDNGGGGCLIATAAYGSEMSPQVQFLREIRDGKVMSTDSGASFMTGFNSLYYSFSPYIADYQRENPVFKEIVKAGITPMLVSLNVMSLADSEEEILGYGIGVILMNLGMYIAAPALIGIRTYSFLKSRK